jgi:hypothetical protein
MDMQMLRPPTVAGGFHTEHFHRRDPEPFEFARGKRAQKLSRMVGGSAVSADLTLALVGGYGSYAGGRLDRRGQLEDLDLRRRFEDDWLP